jgi:hypothetical protein
MPAATLKEDKKLQTFFKNVVLFSNLLSNLTTNGCEHYNAIPGELELSHSILVHSTFRTGNP